MLGSNSPAGIPLMLSSDRSLKSPVLLLAMTVEALQPSSALYPTCINLRSTVFNRSSAATKSCCNPRLFCSAIEALAADLRAHQQQLMAIAQEMLVGCDDTVWQVAAPTSCSILCALGDSATAKLCRDKQQHEPICV